MKPMFSRTHGPISSAAPGIAVGSAARRRASRAARAGLSTPLIQSAEDRGVAGDLDLGDLPVVGGVVGEDRGDVGDRRPGPAQQPPAPERVPGRVGNEPCPLGDLCGAGAGQRAGTDLARAEPKDRAHVGVLERVPEDRAGDRVLGDAVAPRLVSDPPGLGADELDGRKALALETATAAGASRLEPGDRPPPVREQPSPPPDPSRSQAPPDPRRNQLCRPQGSNVRRA